MVYKAKVLVLSPKLVGRIVLLHSLFMFDEPPVFEVPEARSSKRTCDLRNDAGKKLIYELFTYVHRSSDIRL